MQVKCLRIVYFVNFQVVEINPLSSIKTAMKRIPIGWANAWIPSECISLSDALNAYGK